MDSRSTATLFERLKNLLRARANHHQPNHPQTSRQWTGRQGEALAESFLRKEGYQILARNWRSGRSEVDLVARERDILVFVEVKTRHPDDLVGGYAAMNQRKRSALRRAANAWMAKAVPRPLTHRLDLVEVRLAPGIEPVIRHYSNLPF